MKALTICEPFATAVAYGIKQTENRTRPTHYRGWVLIHCGKSTQWMGAMQDRRVSWELKGLPIAKHMGCIIGKANLYDCVPPQDCGDDMWANGPWCWRLELAKVLAKPIPLRGQLGLFDVPGELLGNAEWLKPDQALARLRDQHFSARHDPDRVYPPELRRR